MNRTKKILAAVLALAMVVAMSVFAFADGDVKPKVRLGNVTVYEATKDKSIVTIPIIVDGTIDMQCYDITVTYDKSYLYTDEKVTGKIAGINAFEGGYQEINTATKGQLRIAGVTTDEKALNATGEVGSITFVLGKRIMKDTTIKVEVSANEFGFGTEAKDVEYTAANVMFTKTAAPEPTPSPSPTPAPYKAGDVDGDGIINASDALMVLQHAANVETIEGDAAVRADINGDGVINASDALAILNIAAGVE